MTTNQKSPPTPRKIASRSRGYGGQGKIQMSKKNNRRDEPQLISISSLLTTFISGLFKKGDIDEQAYNQYQTKCDYGLSVNVPKINHRLSWLNTLKRKAISKLNIPSRISAVNINSVRGEYAKVKLRLIKAAPNQPAAILTNNSERILSQTRRFCSMRRKIADIFLAVTNPSFGF